MTSALLFSAPVQTGPRTQIGGLLRVALLSTALLGTCLGGAALLPLDGAVIAQGHLLLAGKPQPLQSLEPGLVAKVQIREGEHVEAGQVLLTLDPTQPRARLKIATERLANALSEESRLMAEAVGQARPAPITADLPFPLPDLTRATARQTALLDARQRQREEAQRQLAETNAQIGAQIDGIRAQQEATREQARLLRQDLDRQAGLVAEGLAREAPLNQLRREEAALTGQIASMTAEIARLEGARREAALMLAQEDSRRGEEVAQSLSDASALVQELVAEIVSLREMLARTELRAPVSGIVHELVAPAPGAVVSAGMTLAQIVPLGQKLEIEVAVDPRNIDSLHEGQRAEVMLTAFDPHSVPKMQAVVSRIPPDAVTIPESGRTFYRVALELAPDALPEGLSLRSGMPVQAFIATGNRSLLDWLVAPLARPLAGAMRED